MDLPNTEPERLNAKLNKELSVKGLFNNFFLLHDFFYRLSKMKATSPEFFDMQFDAANSITHATKSGGRMGQIGAFGGLCLYFIKGTSKGI